MPHAGLALLHRLDAWSWALHWRAVCSRQKDHLAGLAACHEGVIKALSVDAARARRTLCCGGKQCDV